jgi:hypothetical protein
MAVSKKTEQPQEQKEKTFVIGEQALNQLLLMLSKVSWEHAHPMIQLIQGNVKEVTVEETK